jgi:IS30 family transposase
VDQRVQRRFMVTGLQAGDRRPGHLRKRHSRANGRIRFLAPALLIGQRPAVVETRQRVVDWEGELIVERMSQSAIDDSRSRYLRLVHCPRGTVLSGAGKACCGPGQRPRARGCH